MRLGLPIALPAPAKPAAALSYLDYGSRLGRPAYGSIAVKKRKGGGHVGIVVGRYPDGRLGILGANQDDQVKVSPYKASDFETFRWPTGNMPADGRYDLPLLNNAGKAAGSEA